MADEVVLAVEKSPSRTVIRADGYLDVSTAPRLREKIQEVAAGGGLRVLLLDLGGIEFLDSSGLGVILHGWKLLRDSGGTLAVISPQPRITKVFEITALNLSVPIFGTEHEAAAGLGLDPSGGNARER